MKLNVQQAYEIIDELSPDMLRIRSTHAPQGTSVTFTSAEEFSEAYVEFLLAASRDLSASGDFATAFDKNLHIIQFNFVFGLIAIDLVVEHYSRNIQKLMPVKLSCGHEIPSDLAINFCPECGTAIEKD